MYEIEYRRSALKGDLSGYFSCDFTFKSVEYRLIYTYSPLRFL